MDVAKYTPLLLHHDRYSVVYEILYRDTDGETVTFYSIERKMFGGLFSKIVVYSGDPNELTSLVSLAENYEYMMLSHRAANPPILEVIWDLIRGK